MYGTYQFLKKESTYTSALALMEEEDGPAVSAEPGGDPAG